MDRRCLDKALRPGDHECESFAGTQGVRRFDRNIASGLGGDLKVRPLAARPTRVGLDRARLGTGRKGDAGGCGEDRERPSVAGDVPVEFVEVLEKSQLRTRAVFDRVGRLHVRQENIRAAQINPQAV